LLQVGDGCAQGVCVLSPGGAGQPNLQLLVCKNGFIMCGYLSREAADKFGDAAVIVGGVVRDGQTEVIMSAEGLLGGVVRAVSEKAALLGISVGMSGLEAAIRLNR
jgi:uncharacterized protein YunC (DUF1805 family)